MTQEEYKDLEDEAWYFHDDGQYEKAIELRTRLIALDPGNAVHYSMRAIAYQCLRNLDQAIADTNIAIVLRADAGDFRHRGHLYELKADYEAAERNYLHADALYGGNTEHNLFIHRQMRRQLERSMKALDYGAALMTLRESLVLCEKEPYHLHIMVNVVNEEIAELTSPLTVAMPDSDAILYRVFFEKPEADVLFARLRDEIAWNQETIGTPRGRVPLPRLTAWYGDAGTTYRYSGIVQHPLAWIPLLQEIKTRVETAAETTFNSVLLNYYRDGRDSVSWHSDDEPELGQNPVIASVSFGAAREFQFKHKANPDIRAAVDLTHGSLLIMRGATQHHWLHRIPKTNKPLEGRINLTFRVIHV